MTTTPDVFIVESLDFEDERDNRHEGRIISQILALSKKSCKYVYLRTRREFEKVLEQFTESRYRYLHISCHSNSHELATTLDSIPLKDLATILKPHLKRRRLFLSACSLTNKTLASYIMPDSECWSIVGPAEDVNFNDAAILWPSLYHAMFADNSNKMKSEVLKAKAQEVVNMFRVSLNCFTRNREKTAGYDYRRIKPQTEN